MRKKKKVVFKRKSGCTSPQKTSHRVLYPQSAKEEIERCHLQVMIRVSGTSKDMFPDKLGWKMDDQTNCYIPFWYEGPVLPLMQTSSTMSPDGEPLSKRPLIDGSPEITISSTRPN